MIQKKCVFKALLLVAEFVDFHFIAVFGTRLPTGPPTNEATQIRHEGRLAVVVPGSDAPKLGVLRFGGGQTGALKAALKKR